MEMSQDERYQGRREVQARIAHPVWSPGWPSPLSFPGPCSPPKTQVFRFSDCPLRRTRDGDWAGQEWRRRRAGSGSASLPHTPLVALPVVTLSHVTSVKAEAQEYGQSQTYTSHPDISHAGPMSSLRSWCWGKSPGHLRPNTSNTILVVSPKPYSP